MNFRRRPPRSEPDIQLIAFIDVMLVLVIFLMLTTTWSRLTEVPLQLAVADVQPHSPAPQVVVSVSVFGEYSVNRDAVSGSSVQALASALAPLAGPSTRLVIRADAGAPHQAVVRVMEAARLQGLSQITFATRSAAR